jgi:periplasmic protein TonB
VSGIFLRRIVLISILCLSVLAQAQLKPARVRISQKVSETLVVSKVQPRYPEEARRKHIQGPVIMRAEITKDGVVESLDVLSGDPVLAAAATDAVKQWKYKPFLLNGDPMAVETQVTVNFTLADK